MPLASRERVRGEAVASSRIVAVITPASLGESAGSRACDVRQEAAGSTGSEVARSALPSLAMMPSDWSLRTTR